MVDSTSRHWDTGPSAMNQQHRCEEREVQYFAIGIIIWFLNPSERMGLVFSICANWRQSQIVLLNRQGDSEIIIESRENTSDCSAIMVMTSRCGLLLCWRELQRHQMAHSTIESRVFPHWVIYRFKSTAFWICLLFKARISRRSNVLSTTSS